MSLGEVSPEVLLVIDSDLVLRKRVVDQVAVENCTSCHIAKSELKCCY